MARKMKDSGIEWIGEIPEGWEITRLKYLADFEPTCDTSYLTDESKITYTPMECVKNGGFENRSALYGNLSHTLTPFQNGDIAMAKVTPCFENGNIAIMDNLFSGFGLGSSELFIFRPKSISTRYFFYWLQNKAFVARACSTMTGTGGLKRISPSFIRNCPVHCPSTDEQTKISDYLDAKCSEIDDLLTSVRSSIEEYKKLKQSVITQAVTKTIYDDFGNPSKFRKLRSLCDVLSKGTTPKDIETQNDEFYCIRYLKSENIVSNQLNLNPTFFITAETNNSLERSKLNSGDILFVIAGASIGKVAITTADFLPANTNQAVAFIRLSSSYQYATKYIWYFLQSDVVKQLIALSAVQSAQPNLSLEDLGAMRLPLPDQMGCLKITDYLDAKCAEIDGLIVKKEQLVKELESYKKSLIYEVVTGKREV